MTDDLYRYESEGTVTLDAWHTAVNLGREHGERMPNNPFPRGSVWGDAIDASYRFDRYHRRRPRALTQNY